MLVFAFIVGLGSMIGLASCKQNDNGKLNIVCTTFPEYEWAREIIGEEKDNFNLKLLMNNGTDLHSYQPSIPDIAKITTSDIFIYVGGESDEWVEDVLKNAKNKNMITINLLEVLGDKAKEEEVKEGMQEEHEGEEHEHDEEEVEYDEHVWLSIKNAKIFVEEIAQAVASIDSENESIYFDNANEYISKLSALDSLYEETFENAQTKTLLFADRFPFRYLVEDYGLDYYAAFVGCSAETEASFETIEFLTSKVNDLHIKVILKIETSGDSIAKTIKENSHDKDQQILTLDSMQNTTLKSKKTYLSILESNLEVFQEAVN